MYVQDRKFKIKLFTKLANQNFAYRRPKNLRDFLVKAKLKQPSQSNKTQPNIISRCNDGRCRTCKGPVKLIKRVKIAHSFSQSVSDQFHLIILSLLM